MSEQKQTQLSRPDQAFIRKVLGKTFVIFIVFLFAINLLFLLSTTLVSTRLKRDLRSGQTSPEQQVSQQVGNELPLLSEKQSNTVDHCFYRLQMVLIIFDIVAIGFVLCLSWALKRLLTRYFCGYRNLLSDSQTKVEEMTTILVTQTKMADMGQMLDIIAHQLKTPLQEILSSVEMILFQLDDHPDVKKETGTLLKTVDENVRYMTDTIDDLRSFLKPDKSIGVYDLTKIIDKAIRIVYPKLKRNSIQVKKDFENVNTLIRSSSSELQQVIIALLVNGIDVFQEDPVKNPMFHLRISEEGGYVVLEIEDNAGGIPETVIDQVFEPYFTTKKESGGTGIGLYMSRKIIEQGMKGHLSVRNTDMGACFTIRLKQYTGSVDAVEEDVEEIEDLAENTA